MADGSVKILTALDNTGLEKGLKSMNSKVAAGAKSAAGAMATGLKGVGTAIGAATAALGGIGAAVIKTGSEFEAKMSRVKAISNATSSEFQQLNAQAKKLGADTAFSASEAADGMENLAAAGFSVNEITKAMPGLLDMAAASGESIANSSEIASSALRAFGLDASKTGHIADVLAANANMTNAAVMDTGYAFKYAAPIAHSLGMSMEETTAAIGIMSNAGIKGEQAGTTLRGALTRLVKPTKQVKKGMAELGVSFFDSNGKMKSLDTIVGDLSTSTAKLTQQQKNQTLAQIFGTESLSGMLALVDAGPAKLEKLTKAYEHSDGAAKAAAKTMQDNLKGAIEQAGGSLETLGIDLYESVDNPAKKAVQAVTDYINQLSKAFEGKGWDGFTKEIGTVAADAVKQIAAAAPDAVKEGSNLIKSLADGISDNSDDIAKSAVEIGKSLISGIEETVPALGKAAGGLIKGIITGIAGDDAGNAIQEAIDNIGKAFESLKPAAGEAIRSITQIIAGLSSTIANVSSAVLPILTSAVQFVAQNLQSILPIIAGVTLGIKGFEVAKTASIAINGMAAAFKAAAAAETIAGTAASLAGGPIGILAGIAVGLGAAFLTAAANSDGFDTAQKKLERSSTELGKTFKNVADGVNDFTNGVDTASSHYDSLEKKFDQSKFGTKLNGDMESLQQQINAIVEKASSERRAMTDKEVSELNVLIQKEAEATRQKAVTVQKSINPEIDNLTSNKSISDSDYKKQAQEMIKTAQDAATKVKTANHEAYVSQVDAAAKAYGEGTAKYKAAAAAAAKTEADENAKADAEQQAETAKLADGYLQRTKSLQTYSSNVKIEYDKLAAENATYNSKLAELEAAQRKMAETHSSAAQLSDGSWVTSSNVSSKITQLKDNYDKATAAIQNDLNKLTEGQQSQVGEFLGYIKEMDGGFDKLDNSGKTAVANLLSTFNSLPESGKSAINDALHSMGLEIESNGDLVKYANGKAGEVVVSMNEVMKSGKVSTPNVDPTALVSSATSAAVSARNAIIAELTGQSITVGAQIAIAATGGSAKKSANGRIATQPMLSTLCEEGYPEAIIPFNPARRARALDLWQQTGKALGVMQNANGGIYGTLPSNPKVAVSAPMMSSILGWAKINAGKDDKLSEKIVEQAEKTLDNLKQYDELSTAEEVKFWEKVKKIRGLAGDQLNEIDHKIYDAKKANSEAIVSDAESYLNHYKNIGQMTDDWELSYWQRTLQREGLYADQKKEIEEKIYTLQKQRTQDIISDAEKRFSHAEAIGQQDAEAELRYWQNLVKTEKLGGDEYNSVLEKIYSAQQKVKEELSQKSKDNYDYFNGFIQDDKDFGKIDTAGELARWKKVYDDYKNGLIFLQADEAKQIEKNIYSLQKEVDSSAQSAQDTAKQNWQSRVDSLKSWTGMFDEPSYNYETSKEELMWNMQEQVRMMQDWQSDLANLQARGISSAMAKELENLGPTSADKIRALSEMTDEELQKYSALYAQKGGIATGQANSEIGIMPAVTDSAAAAVTQSVQSSVSSLSDAVQQQLPTLTAQFAQGGTNAGNAYGSAFVARVKSAMSDFNGVVASAVSNAQVQLSSTMQSANAASSAIDRLNAKVSGLKVEQVQQVTQLDVSGRTLAKAISPYAGTYLKLNGG